MLQHLRLSYDGVMRERKVVKRLFFNLLSIRSKYINNTVPCPKDALSQQLTTCLLELGIKELFFVEKGVGNVRGLRGVQRLGCLP